MPVETYRERAVAYRGADGTELLVLAAPLSGRAAVPSGVEIVTVDERSPVAVIRENLDVNEQGFDPAAETVGDAQAEAFRPQLRAGRAVTVRAGGEAVAAGMMLPIRDGVTELAGIVTLERHRGRGFGRLVTEALVATAFGLGADLVVLVTDEPAARRLYRRIGFVPC